MDQKEIEEKLKNFQVKHIEKPEKKEEQPLSDHVGFCEQWKHAAKILIGIGGEWKKSKREDICEAYDFLAKCLEGRDYFIVTTNTDAEIFRSRLDASRITAPCGNETWRQCSRSCTKDIWEPGEIPDDICPHCGAPLCGNTIDADSYIEEGYLPQWMAYTRWLTGTVNRPLLVLELGEGFKTPTVIRWPFEKTVRFNKKSCFYRVNVKFAQLAEETDERSVSVAENSVDWVSAMLKTL